MKLSTTKQNASTDVVVSLVEKQIFLEINKYFCTHHVGGGTAALGGVAGAVGRGPVGVVVAVPNPELTLATITLVYHQVYRHLAFQT